MTDGYVRVVNKSGEGQMFVSDSEKPHRKCRPAAVITALRRGRRPGGRIATSLGLV